MKPNRLKKGDKVAIVSLSSGILGEDFAKHELELGIKRLEEFSLIPVFMDNSLKGMTYLKDHPEKRAEDLKQAFLYKDIKAIICAIGGNDTYRTLPHLLSDKEFVEAVKTNPKIFLGFSDSTTNHLMLNKLGLTTFYGQAFLTDLAEFEPQMLEYSKNAFEYLFNAPQNHQINPSKFWFEDRTDYSPSAVGTMRNSHQNRGYEVLQGTNTSEGILLGGCVEVLAEYIGLASENQEKIENIVKDYNVFPSCEDWKGKIMLLETSEGKLEPEKYRAFIKKLKAIGIAKNLNGIIAGKPIDEVYYEEYKQILKEEFSEFNFPILYNINVGHAYPHTILPLGETVIIDPINKTLTIKNSALK